MAHPESADVHPRKHPNYLLVFFVLMLLTALEVGITRPELNLPAVIVTPSLLAFMIFKVLLVVMFYMHLRIDSRYFTYLFLIPLPFVALILVALIIGFRTGQ